MRRLAKLGLVLAMSIGLLGGVIPQASAGSIYIRKIYFDSPGSDTRSASSLNAEYIQISNSGSTTRYLSNWTIKDYAGHVYKFGSFTLRAGGTVTVHTGRGTNSSTHRYWGSGNYIWNNDGDRAWLRNSSGTLQDYCTYTGAGDYTYCK